MQEYTLLEAIFIAVAAAGKDVDDGSAMLLYLPLITCILRDEFRWSLTGPA